MAPRTFATRPDEPSHAPGTQTGSRRAQAAERWRDRLVLDTLRALFRHKVLCFVAVVLASAAGWIATMTMTPYYVAQARIYPPMAQGSLGGFGLPGVASLLGNFGVSQPSASQFPLYEKALYSRDLLLKLLTTPLTEVGVEGTVQSYLKIEQSDPAMQQAIGVEALRARLTYETETQTTVATVGFRDKNPEVAAFLVNRCVELLNEFDVSTSTAKASEQLTFIEARLEVASRSLATAEKNLETFRAENVRIGNAPHLLTELAHLQREVEIEQQVYLTLRTEAEKAQIDEKRSVPVVNVLEHAVPPLYPAGPSRIRNAFLAGCLAGLFVLGFFTIRAARPRSLLVSAGFIAERS